MDFTNRFTTISCSLSDVSVLKRSLLLLYFHPQFIHYYYHNAPRVFIFYLFIKEDKSYYFAVAYSQETGRLGSDLDKINENSNRYNINI